MPTPRWFGLLSLLLVGAARLEAAGRVAITEVHYHPPASQGEHLEFVEIRNVSGAPLSLAGWRLAGGIEFRFPESAALAPGAYGLVCHDAHVFGNAYSAAQPRILGSYSGYLDDGGDTIDLLDGWGAFVDGLTYDDRKPWPEAGPTGIEADGAGGSLQRICETAATDDPLNWTGAFAPTPGEANPGAACPPPAWVAPDVVISEVFYHPEDSVAEHPSTDDGESTEFVEIHNRTAAAKDVSGWTFAGGVQFRFPDGQTIEPGGYLVVCRDEAVLRAAYDLSSIAGEFFGRLSNDGERILLLDSGGAYVDSVSYGTAGPWPYAADGLGHSLERVAASLPSHDAANWAPGPPPTATFQRLVGSGGLGQGLRQIFVLAVNGTGEEVIVDDIVLEDLEAPGVNLLGNGDFEAGGAGWDVGGLAAESTFDPGIGVGGSTALRLRSSAPCPGGECGVANGVSRTVTEGIVRGHTYRVTLRVKYARGGLGFRAGLFRGAEVHAGGFVSPGRENLAAASRLPIEISKVSRFPTEPRSTDSTWITARVRSADPPAVSLAYTARDGGATVPMLDDGLHRDGVAGDGVFGAELPPFPHDTRVTFRIQASAGGDRGVFPRPRSIDFPLPEEVWGYYVNDNQVDSPLPVYHLLVPGVDPTLPETINEFLDCIDLTPAGFAYRGDLWPNVGLRFRGNTACVIQKRNFKVVFDRIRSFRGLRKINLNGLWTDKAIVREHLAWDFFRAIGAPYMENEFIRVHLNGAYHGLFLYVEHPDGNFLDRNGLSGNANLYKAAQPAFVQGDIPIGVEVWSDPADYRTAWEREINEQGDYGDLIQFISSMHADGKAAGGPSRDFWRNRSFEEMILRYQLAQVALNNIDSFAKNHFLYHDLDQDRWGFISWDMDLVMGKFFTRDAVSPPERPVGTLNDLMLSDPEVQGDLTPWFAATVNGGQRLNWLVDFFLRAGGGHYQRAYLIRLSDLLEETYRNEVYDARLDDLAAFLEDEEREDFLRWGRYVSNVEGFPEEMLPNIAIVKSQIRLHTDYLRRYLEFFHSDEIVHPRFQISEIMYLPEGGDESLEFVEFVNLSGSPVDISGWFLAGITYVFPPGSVIPAGEPVVVAKSPAAIRGRYPGRWIPNLYGPFDGRLANEGEELLLLDDGPGHPATIDRVEYDGRAPWPTPLAGYSLELTDVSVHRNNGDPSTWIVSDQLGGTPGLDAVTFSRGDANSDAALNLTDAVFVLEYLFRGGSEPACLDAADSNDDGRIDLTDPIYVLNHLFLGGGEPPPPYPGAGVDRTADELGC